MLSPRNIKARSTIHDAARTGVSSPVDLFGFMDHSNTGKVDEERFCAVWVERVARPDIQTPEEVTRVSDNLTDPCMPTSFACTSEPYA